MGQPAKDWMLGILDVHRRLRILDNGLWITLAVLTFTRDAEIWWEIVLGHYKVNRMT